MTRNNESEPVQLVHLMGGLGNQLFQIAAGLYQSFESGRSLVIDDSYGNFRKNSFGKADIFTYHCEYFLVADNQTKSRFLSRKIIALLLRSSFNSRRLRFTQLLVKCLKLILSCLLTLRFDKPLKVWSATNLGFEKIQSSKLSQYLIGYFQTFKYASDPRVLNILKDLSISSEEIEKYREMAITERPLIIHVRLGDYKEETKFGILPPMYYEKAISEMLLNFHLAKFWIFSDEIEKAKSYIPEIYHPVCRWINDKNEPSAVTLEKMRLGRCYIIGNSTFSWWGAFLSHTSNPPTIAPNPWFIKEEDPSDLIPLGWKIISR
jgi:hypothetical protein